jgi:hypothetical protein
MQPLGLLHYAMARPRLAASIVGQLGRDVGLAESGLLRAKAGRFTYKSALMELRTYRKSALHGADLISGLVAYANTSAATASTKTTLTNALL